MGPLNFGSEYTPSAYRSPANKEINPCNPEPIESRLPLVEVDLDGANFETQHVDTPKYDVREHPYSDDLKVDLDNPGTWSE